MKKFLSTLVVMLGLGLAQTLGVGLVAHGPGPRVAGTLESRLALGAWTLEGWSQVGLWPSPSASLGFGATYALELGPAGLASLTGQAFVRWPSLDFWGRADLKGTFGPAALSAGLGYSTAPRELFWPESALGQGLVATAKLDYRLARRQIASLHLVYEENGRTFTEASLTERDRRSQRTFGLGLSTEQPYLFLLGGRKERLGSGVVEATLRIGGLNRITLSYFARDLRATLEAGAPWYVRGEVAWGNTWASMRGDAGGYTFWGGYRWQLDAQGGLW